MAAKKAVTKKKTAKKAKKAAPADLREPLAPTAANLKATLEAVRDLLGRLTPPKDPVKGDLIHAFVHHVFSRGLPCGYGQEVMRRIDSEYVDRNEFRVTEAYELEELLADLEIPSCFERCLEVVEAVREIYNDQNGVHLEFLREATISERKHFYGRIPAIQPHAAHFLNNLVAMEELALSPRSVQRVLQRLGLEPKDKAVEAFCADLRELLAPWGHIPFLVADPAVDGKASGEPIPDPALSVGSLLMRLTPPEKGGKKK